MGQLELIFILIWSILSIILVNHILRLDKYESKKNTYLLLNFLGFFILYFSFYLILENVAYGVAFSLIFTSEAFFWASLKFVESERYSRHYENISFINTSLIGGIYLIATFMILFANDFSINESNAYIFTTLLLISVFKTLYGIIIKPHYTHYIQLHIYGYIFLFISLFLVSNSAIKSFFFNITGFLITLYSANEISEIKQSQFNRSTFTIWLLIIFVSVFFSMFLTLKIAPIFSLVSIGLIIATTLVKIEKNEYDTETQSIIGLLIIISSFILYYLMTHTLFILDQIKEILFFIINNQ